jgi:hypothetical protein
VHAVAVVGFTLESSALTLRGDVDDEFSALVLLCQFLSTTIGRFPHPFGRSSWPRPQFKQLWWRVVFIGGLFSVLQDPVSPHFG